MGGEILAVDLSSVPIFSWSVSRYKLYNACKRAYFYNYYLSNASASTNCCEQIEILKKLKRLKNIELIVNQSFLDGLTQTFSTSGRKIRRNLQEKFLKSAICELKRNFGSSSADGFSDIYEVVYDELSLNDAFDKAYFLLKEAVARFENTELFDELLDVSYVNIKQFIPPIYAYFNGIRVWARPALMWTASGEQHVLNVAFGGKNNTYPISLGISAIYLAQRTNSSYNSIKSRKLFLSDTSEIYEGQLQVEDLVEYVAETSNEMLDAILGRDLIDELMFERCDNAQVCEKCKFLMFCNKRSN
jgi:hypothetical protein